MMSNQRELYRVILDDGTIQLPCVCREQAAAYVRGWNELTEPKESSAQLQPLEPSLISALFGETLS